MTWEEEGPLRSKRSVSVDEMQSEEGDTEPGIKKSPTGLESCLAGKSTDRSLISFAKML